jgi:hypothetical protein
MIYFRITVALTTVVVFFSLGTAYTINDDCAGYATDIQRWVKEAVYLFDRSATVLNSYFDRLDIGRDNPSTAHILNTLLGRATERSDYESIRSMVFPRVPGPQKPMGSRLLMSLSIALDMYQGIVHNVSTLGQGNIDIQFRCTGPTQFTRIWLEGQRPSVKWAYLLPLKRIGVSPSKISRQNRIYLDDSGQNLLAFVVDPRITGGVRASTFGSYPGSTIDRLIQNVTGSRYTYSDIALDKVESEMAICDGWPYATLFATRPS